MEVAASAGSLQSVQLLLGAGASPRGGSLHKAVEGRHWSIAELLLDRGAEPDLLDGEGRSPLSLAALAEHCGLIELLVGRGACPDGGEGETVTPLGHAILQGQQEVVCCLLELGASPNKGDKLGRSILDLAVHTCNPELVATLLQVSKWDEIIWRCSNLTLSSGRGRARAAGWERDSTVGSRNCSCKCRGLLLNMSMWLLVRRVQYVPLGEMLDRCA